eukprot:5279295-Amphidinium_carterae.1
MSSNETQRRQQSCSAIQTAHEDIRQCPKHFIANCRKHLTTAIAKTSTRCYAMLVLSSRLKSSSRLGKQSQKAGKWPTNHAICDVKRTLPNSEIQL